MTNELRYIGHSAFYIKTENSGILIDPFISQNPYAKFDLNHNKITHIILTHGHGDHLGDAIPIAKKTGATIIAIFELANYCAQRGAKAMPVGMGAELSFEWGKMIFVPAFHSSSTPDGQYAGMPTGVIFEIDGVKIYHAGDTALNTEMKLIGELYEPYYSLLPIGGLFTMGINEAAMAARMLRTKEVIPMHYNTFEAIKANPTELEVLLERQGQKATILKPNEAVEL
ncbi:MAG: metal-dependent hydrolase [Candidatus Gastranaerophilales bacterium]|nr:metal-dependent hydrolase [Candidatus Gastranaerophilales bacterium]